MSEAANFRDLVREALISPLRSVLIIDDQYPTWEEIFKSKIDLMEKSEEVEERSFQKKWHNALVSNEVLRIIRQFRDRKPGFIIDIHDGISSESSQKTAGSETPDQLASHLYQSDLLILDYNLEGVETGTGGDTARKILSSVLNNQHFNLVVIHTSEDLNKVMHECLISLMVSCTSCFSVDCISEISELEEIIQEREDEGEFDRADVEEMLNIDSYLTARKADGSLNREALVQFIHGEGKFLTLNNWCSRLNLLERQKKTFFYWAISLFENKYKSQFTEKPPKRLLWRNNAECKWLRTSRGFVCFVEKGPEDIILELENALVDWKPTPSRLISAKYRDEISRMGAEVEDTTLSQRHAFAKFYETIRKPGREDLGEEQINILRKYKLREHVSRQSEMLSFLVEENVSDFGLKIYNADKALKFEFEKYYQVDLSNNKENQTAISQYNRYVCCLPSKEAVTGQSYQEQLDSGHIFKLGEEWWVCATPACDLQPGQSVIAFEKGTDQSLRPFTALQLHPIHSLNELTTKHINSGSYCYVEYDGKIIGLGVNSARADISGPATQKVTWRSFISKNGGIISNGKLELFEIALEIENEKLKSLQREARVISKLRYEYALNFIQRVGVSASRVGLGYVSS